jgi:hypothetical protein
MTVTAPAVSRNQRLDLQPPWDEGAKDTFKIKSEYSGAHSKALERKPGFERGLFQTK